MKDIFDAKIICKHCETEMKPIALEKAGFSLRAVHCSTCNEKIVHPSDLHHMEHYNNLKRKTFSVKLRMVGNSHAISIPKEIVDFINEANHRAQKQMNDMVSLCFEDFGRIRLNFFDVEVFDKPRNLVRGTLRTQENVETFSAQKIPHGKNFHASKSPKQITQGLFDAQEEKWQKMKLD